MDMRMVDNEDQREDRKAQDGSDVKPEMRRIPSRRERRLIAKRRGVFKTEHRGAWQYVNRGAKKNIPIRNDETLDAD